MDHRGDRERNREGVGRAGENCLSTRRSRRTKQRHAAQLRLIGWFGLPQCAMDHDSRRREGHDGMHAGLRHRIISGLLLGATLLAVLLYLSGLASTLQLGDAANRGVLLVPALPTPLYMT